METWLGPLQEHTFRTYSFELTPEELNVILQCNHALFRRNDFSKEQETVLRAVRPFLESPHVH